MKRSAAFRDKTAILQTQLWGFDCSPYKILIGQFQEFVEHYPDYRVCIIFPHLNDNHNTDFHGEEYVEDKDKSIFIYYDTDQEHYIACTSPKALIESYKNGYKVLWCWICAYWIPAETVNERSCRCGETTNRKKVYKRAICDGESGCNETYKRGTRHVCYRTQCQYCPSLFEKGTPHVCPLTVGGKNFKKTFIGDDFAEIDLGTEEDGRFDKNEAQYNLFVWDIESALVLIPDEEGTEFGFNDDGSLEVDEDGQARTFTTTKNYQVPNFICWRNVFTGRHWESNNIAEFIEFALTENDGRNIFLAHNSSGYDSRLLFEELVKFCPKETKINPIMRGGKFMSIIINGTTRFQDSLLHLRGSLASLARGFNLQMEKGYFPHLFNTESNYDYAGQIPEKKNFDVGLMVNNARELEAFNKWHDEYQGDWVFKTELEKYCVKDVELLAKIVLTYHQELTEGLNVKFPKIAISPWFFPTMAGHVHKIMLRNLHDTKGLEDMNLEEQQAYAQTTWCVLTSEEHYFAKRALRGGRTDIRKYYHKGKIHYKDIQSHYPNVQLKYPYPVGTPTIEVFDKEYYPCSTHWFAQGEVCDCTWEYKINRPSKRVDIILRDEPTDIHNYIRNFFGIIMVDVTPPDNLYHGVLVYYDETTHKCVAPLTPMTKGTFTSVELDVAIQHGYVVTKIYRADRYKYAPSLWRESGLLGEMYLNKMRNSGTAPEDEGERRRMRDYFLNTFGIELDDMDFWVKNPTKKQVHKGPPTAAWGKHAESVDHGKVEIFSDECAQDNFEFYHRVNDNDFKVDQFLHVSNNRTMFKYTDKRSKVRPNLHKGYLPVAVFVTAYARLELWGEMHKLGDRVLMHDTDSIVYYDKEGDPNQYQIPEGDCLGDWETEDLETDNGGITEFVAISPKSYAIRTANGKEIIKCKGVSIKHCHKEMFNFDVAKEILMENKVLALPQMSFDYTMSKGISTRKFLKYVRFNESMCKGIYDPTTHQTFPFGYKRIC